MSNLAKPGLFQLFASVCIAIAMCVPSYADDENWTSLREEMFKDRQIEKAAGRYKIFVDSDVRDAALVPISLRISSKMVPKTSRAYLLIDNNPAPVAAVFEFGDGYRSGGDIGERNIETRIRLNANSDIRAIFETDDGKLYMADSSARGGGGCSSIPAKDLDKILAQLGRIKVKLVAQPAISEHWRDATVMVRHPNFTGMQPDEKNGGFTPAWYVERINVMHGGKMVFRLNAGISLSTDPNVRFTFGASGKEDELSVTVVDSKGKQFRGKSTPSGS